VSTPLLIVQWAGSEPCCDAEFVIGTPQQRRQSVPQLKSLLLSSQHKSTAVIEASYSNYYYFRSSSKLHMQIEFFNIYRQSSQQLAWSNKFFHILNPKPLSGFVQVK
jgi:hypothetical protein